MTIPYLQDQLNRSLKNLGLDCIDLMYIHNAAEGQLQDISKEEFMKNLKDVFEFYEKQRKDQVIRYYGMATWECFRVTKEHPQYLSLYDIVKIAKEVGGENNGFRFIQLPYNMYLDQALTLKNQEIDSVQHSILEASIKLGIGVFASVPLMQAKSSGSKYFTRIWRIVKTFSSGNSICKIYTWNHSTASRTKISESCSRKSRYFIYTCFE